MEIRSDHVSAQYRRPRIDQVRPQHRRDSISTKKTDVEILPPVDFAQGLTGLIVKKIDIVFFYRKEERYSSNRRRDQSAYLDAFSGLPKTRRKSHRYSGKIKHRRL